jgi:branched-subunit amino acid transport protein
MAQAVSRRFLIAESRALARVNPCEFVVDKVALGQVFLRVLRFSPVNIISPSFSILIYHLGDEQYVR